MSKLEHSGIEDVWVGLDKMSGELVVSDHWIKSTGIGIVGTEVPWLNGQQISNASLKCTFMNVAKKGYASNT